jgi:hypothetical protein
MGGSGDGLVPVVVAIVVLLSSSSSSVAKNFVSKKKKDRKIKNKNLPVAETSDVDVSRASGEVTWRHGIGIVIVVSASQALVGVVVLFVFGAWCVGGGER